MKDKKSFGSFIREKRIEKNYSQKDLAQLLYVTESAVSKWERGITYPDITLISDICRVLDITEHELIECSNDAKYRKMEKESKKFNNLKKTILCIFNISYLVAILTCFIVNLAVKHTLSWFFIVLTAILTGYSFCPTFIWILKTNKKIIFITSTLISSFLLFLSCSVYTNNYWFMIPTIGMILLYFIIFYPILFVSQKEYLNKEKYNKFKKYFLFTYSLGMEVLILLLLVFIYIYVPYNLMLGILILGGCFMIPLIFGVLYILGVNNSVNKIIFLVLLGIILLLIILIVIRSLYVSSSCETKTYIIEDIYSEININVKEYDINIYLSQDNENKVVYKQTNKVSIETKINNNKLVINQYDNRKFYDRLFGFINFKVDIYLTQQSLQLLNIKGSTGNINIAQEFTFNDIIINNSTGNIKCKANVINNINIKNTTGNVQVEGVVKNKNINIQTSTGDIELKDINCEMLDLKVITGYIKINNVLVANDMNIKGKTGDIWFDSIDANNIYITTTTGDVIGNVLSSKIFIVEGTTGDVEVPNTTIGGICMVVVTTGDIRINIK